MNLQQNRIRIREQLKVFRIIVYVILVLVIIMFSFMLFGYMDDEVMGNGTVTGIRDYDLKALVSARTVRIIRHEGEFVERGEKLLEFDDRNQRDRITVLKNQLKELELTIAVKEKDFKLLQKDPLPAYYRHTRPGSVSPGRSMKWRSTKNSTDRKSSPAANSSKSKWSTSATP